MTELADLGQKTLKKWCTSAKMTKLADLGLKTLFWTNSCTFVEIAKKWCTQCKNDKKVLILG